MADKKTLLRSIPKMDELLKNEAFTELDKIYGSKMVLECSRKILDSLRKDILEEKISEFDNDTIINNIKCELSSETSVNLRRVINATGIVLHTNLGRAVIGKKVAENVFNAVSGYSNLEYNIEEGKRGSRHDHARKLLTKLCGTEDAMVVNNNAAAIMLALGAMAKNKEVVVSRGELVEIGGSFRVPEIMELSGNILKEVGTTNKTHPDDYVNAISENTGAFLKVHTSNFKIMGFTEEVDLDTLCKLGHENNLPVIYDLGGGALMDLEQFGIHDEPNVPKLLESGVDILTFSGDKLLGGPQAGIIVGKKKYIDLMKKHPLARAVRVDKFTLSMLCETLKCYLDPEIAVRDVPTISMIAQNIDDLTAKCKKFMKLIENDIECVADRDFGQVGGGSVPTQMIESAVCRITDSRIKADKLERILRIGTPSIIARISKDNVLLDVRTIDESEFPIVADALLKAFDIKEK